MSDKRLNMTIEELNIISNDLADKIVDSICPILYGHLSGYPNGVKGLTYQRVGSWVIAHAIAIICFGGDSKEDKESLFKSVIKESTIMAKYANRIKSQTN